VKAIVARWKRVGTGSGKLAGLGRLLTYALLLFFAVNCITVDFKWPEQLVLGILTIALAVAIHRIADTELITFCLMFASMLATARYAYWRCS
jgi:cellulose synthase (UDP-forming)